MQASHVKQTDVSRSAIIKFPYPLELSTIFLCTSNYQGLAQLYLVNVKNQVLLVTRMKLDSMKLICI